MLVWVQTFGMACRFFREVLIEDFPAEVFLQHPAILFSLITVYADNAASPTAANGMQEIQSPPVTADATACLEAMAEALQDRIVTLAEGSYTATPPVRATPTPLSPPPVHLLYFCHALLVHARPMLADATQLERTVRFLTRMLPLLAHAATPTAHVTNTTTTTTTTSTTSAGVRQEHVVCEALGVLVDAVLLHWPVVHTCRGGVDLVALLATAVVTWVPRPPVAAIEEKQEREDAQPLPRRVPTRISTVLARLAASDIWCRAVPGVHDLLAAYLPCVGSDRPREALAGAFHSLQRLRVSMEAARRFGASGAQIEDVTCALADAREGFGCMHIVQDMAFVRIALTRCLHVLANTAVVEQHAPCHALLLKAMVSPEASIRREAFDALHAAVTVDVRAEADTSVVAFLSTPEAVHLLVGCGFSDEDDRVASTARDIFLTITAPLADNVAAPVRMPNTVPRLHGVCALLQCYATDVVVGKRVLHALSQTMVDPAVPAAHALTVALRSLLHTSATVRRWGRDRLVRLACMAPCPRFDEHLFCDLHAAATASTHHLARAAQGWHHHTDTEAVQLYAVFANADVGVGLRVAAAEQLGLLLHHARYVPLLLAHGILAEACAHIAACTEALVAREQTSTVAPPPHPAPAETSDEHGDTTALLRGCIVVVRLLAQQCSRTRALLMTGDDDGGARSRSVLASCMRYLARVLHPDPRTAQYMATLVAVCVCSPDHVRCAPATLPHPLAPPPADTPHPPAHHGQRALEMAQQDTFVPAHPVGVPNPPPVSGLPTVEFTAAFDAAFAVPIHVVTGTLLSAHHTLDIALPPAFLPAAREMWFQTVVDWAATKQTPVPVDTLVAMYREHHRHVLPPPASLALLTTLHVAAHVAAALHRMHVATSHADVTRCIIVLEGACAGVTGDGRSALVAGRWHEPFMRYLSVRPASASDAALLHRMLGFCTGMVRAGVAGAWLCAVVSTHLLDFVRMAVHPHEDTAATHHDVATAHSFRGLQIAILELMETLHCHTQDTCNGGVALGGVAETTPPQQCTDIAATRASEWFTCLVDKLHTMQAPSDSVFDIHVGIHLFRVLAVLTAPATGVPLRADLLPSLARAITTCVCNALAADDGDATADGTSHVGSTVRRLAMVCALHVALREPQHTLDEVATDADTPLARAPHPASHDPSRPACPGWEAAWLWHGDMAWIAAGCAHHRADVRVPALGLVACLMRHPVLRAQLTTNTGFGVRQGELPLPEAVCALVFDVHECPAVRTAAMDVLTALSVAARRAQARANTDVGDFFAVVHACGVLRNIAWLVEEASTDPTLLHATARCLHHVAVLHPSVVLDAVCAGDACTRLAAAFVHTVDGTSSVRAPTWPALQQLAHTACTLLVLDRESTRAHAIAQRLAGDPRVIASALAVVLLWYDATVEPPRTATHAPTPDDGTTGGRRPSVAIFFQLLIQLLVSDARAAMQKHVWAAAHTQWPALLRVLRVQYGHRKQTTADVHAPGPVPECATFFQLMLDDAATTAAHAQVLDATASTNVATHGQAGGPHEFPTEVLVEQQRAGRDALPPDTVGVALCQILFAVYHGDVRREDPGTVQAVDALASLLAASHTATRCALDTGLLHTFAGDVGEVHAALCMEGLAGAADGHNASVASNDTRTLATATVRTPRLARLRATLRVVANALHASPDARAAALHHGIVRVLEPLWGVCVLADHTLQMLLELLCNYVANTPATARSLAAPHTHKHSLAVAVARFGCKLLRTGGRGSVRATAFDLLTSFVATPECRNVLWREGFVEECVTRLTTAKRPQAPLLKFLAVASHYKEVQHALLRTGAPLRVLVAEVAGNTAATPRTTHALCTVRNLCFARAAYALMARDDPPGLAVLLDLCADATATSPHRTLALEAVRALLAKCNKSEQKLLGPRVTCLLDNTPTATAPAGHGHVAPPALRT